MTEQAIADAARLTHLTATTNGTYTAPYGYSEVEVNVASGSGDCSEAIAEAYQSGYTGGYGDGYDSGYTAGQEDCPECSGGTDCSSAITEAYQSGYTEGLNTAGISYGNSGFTFSTSGIITVSEDISISIDDNDFLLNTDSNQYKYIDGVRMIFPHQSGYTYLLTAGIHTYEVRNIASFQISSGGFPPGLYITPRPNASYYDLTVQSFGNGVVTPQSQYFYVELKQY